LTRVAEHILIVDDDATLRNRLKAYLEKEGFDATAADGGEAMRAVIAKGPVDLIILDLMMPGEDGLSLTRYLRAHTDIPILILTGKGEPVDRIVGLEMGADDYLGKPFNPRELLARVRAVLRRVKQGGEEGADDRILFGEFELDLASHRLARDGNPVTLTSGEFDLLSILASHPNKVLDRDRILDLLTGAERSPFDRSIDVRVTRLRGKIEPDPTEPVYIKTIWGKGYMFCPDGDA